MYAHTHMDTRIHAHLQFGHGLPQLGTGVSLHPQLLLSGIAVVLHATEPSLLGTLLLLQLVHLHLQLAESSCREKQQV